MPTGPCIALMLLTHEFFLGGCNFRAVLAGQTSRSSLFSHLPQTGSTSIGTHLGVIEEKNHSLNSYKNCSLHHSCNTGSTGFDRCLCLIFSPEITRAEHVRFPRKSVPSAPGRTGGVVSRSRLACFSFCQTLTAALQHDSVFVPGAQLLSAATPSI